MKLNIKTIMIATGRLLFAAFLWVVLSADRAKAQEFYLGVHGGRSTAATELTDTGSTFSLNGLSSQGYVGGVHAGVDMRLPSSSIFVGAFTGFDWQNTEFKIVDGSNSFTASLGNSWYLGGRVGTVVHGGKIYVLAAYRQTGWSSSEPDLRLGDLKGFDVGVGIDVPIAKNISLGVEGIHTQFQRGEFSDASTTPATPTGLHAQTDQLSVMARLNIKFGGGEPSIFSNEGDPVPPKQRSPK